MYDIRQFKPALYLIVLLGILGFGLACETPAPAILGFAAVLFNAWLVRKDRFRPIPRWLASAVTLVCLAYGVWLIRQVTPIVAIGEFLIFLQVIKLYEHRANRDLAQLLILSLLLMVASSINTASLLFGLLLILYLFLSLYCCLLFHLKVESEHARSTFVLPADKINPATLRQDQRFLPRSMRRISIPIGFAAIAAAVAVFILFPRAAATGMISQWRPSQTLTGYSEQVSLQDVASITQNPQPIAYVKIWKDDQPLLGTEPLLLRGATHDIYNGPNTRNAGAWQWLRSPSIPLVMHLPPGTTQVLYNPKTGPRYRQKIALLPTGANSLPALGGVLSVTPDRELRLRYYPADRTLRTPDPVLQRTDYEVVSSLTLEQVPSVKPDITPGQFPGTSFPRPTFAHRTSYIDPLVASYARRPEVTGDLAARRPEGDTPLPIDEEIARRIESHLHSTFAYTLDLTDARRVAGRDPIVAFLYDLKRGHCQYFAAAMTNLCQSLHIQARMVVGFKVGTEDFNEIGGYYVVRQSHAHAWVEVLTPDGWKTFDPTTDRGAPPISQVNLFERAKHLANYLDFMWATAVVAYDQEEQSNLLQQTSDKLMSLAQQRSRITREIRSWWLDPHLTSDLTTVVIILIVVALFSSTLLHLRDRIRMNRRAARIGIDVLPSADQQRLVRQLAFYDELIRLLERHRIARPRHLTPLEFSDTLSFLPTGVYDSIRRLTRLFYRIRYGQADLQPARQRRLMSVIERISQSLGPPGPAKN